MKYRNLELVDLIVFKQTEALKADAQAHCSQLRFQIGELEHSTSIYRRGRRLIPGFPLLGELVVAANERKIADLQLRIVALETIIDRRVYVIS